jgi:hypothetical protein
MPSWTVTREHQPARRQAGTEATWPAAWRAAFLAALTEFEDALDAGWCVLIVDGVHAALNAGRDNNGELDLPQTRAGAERMLAAITGDPALELATRR